MTDPLAGLSDVPLAVLIGLDGYQRTWVLMTLPPPPELLIPRSAPVSTTLTPRDPSLPCQNHRVFRLSHDLRSRSSRWWRVYNEGRSRTPEDGFVYLEERTSDD